MTQYELDNLTMFLEVKIDSMLRARLSPGDRLVALLQYGKYLQMYAERLLAARKKPTEG